MTLGERWYRQHVPERDGRLPLVVDLHGYSEGADRHASVTRFESLGDREGFVTVTPQGTGDLPSWDLSTQGADVAFIGEMLDDVERSLCIDADRVFVTGHSMGGFFISTLDCAIADRIAAFAPVAGMRDIPGCAQAHPVPVHVEHGTGDMTVLYEGGLSSGAAAILRMPEDGPSIPALVEAWAARNGCAGDRPTERDEGNVTTITYRCGVELRRIDGGPHEWPAGATERIWRFFDEVGSAGADEVGSD